MTKDEIDNPADLDIVLRVNGETMQRSNMRRVTFGIDSLIEYASAGMTLKTGDIISTGMPEGVTAATGQPFLKEATWSRLRSARLESFATL